MACEVVFVKRNEENFHPLLANFQNDKPKADYCRSLVCETVKDKSDMSLIVASNNGIYKTAVVSNGDNASRTLIVVRNKKTNKVRLYEADNVMLSTGMARKITEDDTSSRQELHNRVNRLFGSKKMIRATKQKEEAQVKIENLKEQLEKTVADVSIDQNDLKQPKMEELMGQSGGGTSYLPPINRNATIRDDVYNLNNLITVNELETLNNYAERMLVAEFDDINCIPLVKVEIEKLQKCQLTHDQKLEKCSLWLYINCLFVCITTPAKQISTIRFRSCQYSEIVNNKIFAEFTVTTGKHRTRPMAMRDKAICYVIVLCLLANDLKFVDLEQISKVISLSTTKLQEFCRVLGLQPVKKELKSLYTVKLPLPPVPTCHARRRSRK